MGFRILVLVVVLVPCALHAGDIQYHFNATATYDLDIPGLNLPSKLITERGDIAGILQDAEVKASGNWEAEASATLQGQKYKLRAEAYVKALGSATGASLLSNAEIDAKMSWTDHYRIVGEGELPFNSTVAKWKFSGSFDYGNISPFYYWDVYGQITFTDPDAASPYNGVIEFFRTNREDVEPVGGTLVSGVAALTYNLDGNRSTNYKLNFGLTGRTNGSWLRILFGKTVELVAIEFPDGTTPEDHGFQIVFDSGVRSPNIAVPEPSATALTAICMVCVAAFVGRLCRAPQQL